MEFIREAELFFIQLQYGLDKGAEPRMPDGTSFAEVESPVFLKYIEDYGIECPFIPKNKIIELITLMQKDNISPKKALEILHNFKKQYWVFDSKVRVHKVGEHFIEGIKAKLTFMSEPEIIEFFYTFLEYTSEKRELIYADLVNEINKLQSTLPTQQIATDTCMPPEPQTITTALTSQFIINRVFRDQIKQRTTFAPICIIAPFVIRDFPSLHENIIAKGTIFPEIRDAMKRIQAKALENINLFEKVRAITMDAKKTAYYTVDKRNSIWVSCGESVSMEIANNPYQQVFTNDDLFNYCDAVEDLMSSCLTPVQKEKERKHAEKWYALYHMILIEIGKQAPLLSSGSKVEIIKYGRGQYGTNQGFYQTLREIELNNMIAFVRCLPKKDRKQWKKIISEISDNDADVISWLKKQPN